MQHFLTVQLGRNDNVLVADITWHDVLVKLHHQVIAIAQYTICWFWCGELAWSRVIFHHYNLFAIDVYRLRAIHRLGIGAERVVALWIEVGITHIIGQTQVTSCGQRFSPQSRRVFFVHHEL